MKLKRRKKRSVLFTILLIIINSIFLINVIGKNITPYIEQMVKNYVNKGIYHYVFNIFDNDILVNNEMINIITLNMNSDKEVVSVDYKLNIAYKYLSEGMDNLYNNINNLKLDFNVYDGDNSIFFIPLGIINKNLLFENMGVKIPCKITFLSDIDMGFKTKVNNYGVNNLLVELYLVINVKNSLVSPSSFYEFGDSYQMLIASKIVVGRLPLYYGDSYEKSSTILSS